MENKRIIQVEEKVPFKMLVPLSIQHMFAMFGASVLVPFVFGINPAVVLFMNGIGTDVYKRQLLDIVQDALIFPVFSRQT